MDKKQTAKGTPKKEATIVELTDKVSRAKSIVFAQFAGIKHKQLEELRRTLRKSNSEFVVTKNRLLKKALGDKASIVESELEQQNASLFAYGDEVAPLKDMLKFFKTVGLGKTKGGLLGMTHLNDAEVTKLSTLPQKNVLLGTLVRQLNGPIQGLHRALQWNMNSLVWVLDAVKNKKTV